VEILSKGQFRFQFLGIPPKGERFNKAVKKNVAKKCFQFLGIPPKGEPYRRVADEVRILVFPISRDPPEGGTLAKQIHDAGGFMFPISRDPPEGFLGIPPKGEPNPPWVDDELYFFGFQFLGIPPKGELWGEHAREAYIQSMSFQFLGIPPKGEPSLGGQLQRLSA